MIFKRVEDGFDALLVRLFGEDLTTLPLEDEEFKRHIEANRMSLWLLVGMLLAITVVTVMVVYGVLETQLEDAQLLSVLTPNQGSLLHILPLTAVAFSFAIIWRNVFNNYAAKFHSETLKRQNSKSYAVLAVFFALLASSLSFFSDPRLYGVMLTLYYISLTLAFVFALVFSSKMYHLVRSVAARHSSADGESEQAHQRFPALAHLTLGWCGTNALTTLVLTAFCSILVGFHFFSTGFHVFSVDTSQGQWFYTNQIHVRIVLLELLILSTFLLMGFFSGTFRRKATAEQFREELLCLNSTLDSSDGSGRGGTGIQASSSPERREDSSNDGATVARERSNISGVTALLESSRAVSSSLVSVLLIFSGGEALLALVLFLFLTSSYLFNDLMDFISGRDVICHPHRALPSGRLSQSTSCVSAVVLALAGISTSLLLETSVFILVIICFLISFAYSVFLKRQFPILATPLWCGATISLFLYSLEVGIVTYVIGFCIVFGRELLLEERDAKGDRVFAISRTFPDLFGAFLPFISFSLIFLGLLGAAFQMPTVPWITIGILVSMLGVTALVLSNAVQRRKLSKLVYIAALVLPV